MSLIDTATVGLSPVEHAARLNAAAVVLDGPRPELAPLQKIIDEIATEKAGSLQGPRPPLAGPRPPAEGPRPPLAGPRPVEEGPRPPLAGPRPPVEGPRPEDAVARELWQEDGLKLVAQWARLRHQYVRRAGSFDVTRLGETWARARYGIERTAKPVAAVAQLVELLQEIQRFEAVRYLASDQSPEGRQLIALEPTLPSKLRELIADARALGPRPEQLKRSLLSTAVAALAQIQRVENELAAAGRTPTLAELDALQQRVAIQAMLQERAATVAEPPPDVRALIAQR